MLFKVDLHYLSFFLCYFVLVNVLECSSMLSCDAQCYCTLLNVWIVIECHKTSCVMTLNVLEC